MYPVLFEIGTIFVSSLWVCVSVGFFVWGVALIKITQLQSLKMAFLVNAFFPILLAGALTGRVIYLLTNLPEIFSTSLSSIPIRLISFWDRGFNVWGMAAGTIIYLIYRAKKEEENMGKWLDTLTLSWLTAIPFGHLGSLLEGINYGRETELPWGIIFESSAVPYTVPIHPTQIYALVYSIVIVGIITYFTLMKKIIKEGEAIYIAAVSYGAMRFSEEFFRGDEAVEFLGLHLAHWVSLLVVLWAGISLLLRYNKLDFILKKFNS